MMLLDIPCEQQTGIGPVLASKLKQCGIETVSDLLFHLPYRYQDRTRITPLQDVRPNEWCVVLGKIHRVQVSYAKRPLLTCVVEDKTGSITLSFFHFNKQQVAHLKEAAFIKAFGEIRSRQHDFEMVHPEYQLMTEEQECVVEETLTPIYPSTTGLSQTRLRQLITKALQSHTEQLKTLEWINPETLKQWGWPTIEEALWQLHHPTPECAIRELETGSLSALQRLVFDELTAKQLSMQFAKLAWRQKKSPIQAYPTPILDRFIKQLPFQLTQAQNRVAGEIQNDLAKPTPMLRLVQGDVGSGKTVIAALAALQVIEAGYQVAFMSPTELLTEQHAQTLLRWFEPLGIQIHRLTGKMKTGEKKKTLEAIAKDAQFIVGTHAVFQKDVIFRQLGLIIIDEQHRFGVKQRLSLQEKGMFDCVPHQLMLTATPIPRTLAMTHFAHLDLSIIDELPPNRSPVITTVMKQEKRMEVIQRLEEAIELNKQIYWVCTLIENSEKLQCKAAEEHAAELRMCLPNARIGLVHGRIPVAKKEEIMLQFKQGALDLLVATTVIEVGVDVPNASVMIIENAERLGLSQLHQLRGRVGRGSKQSHCILLYQGPLSKTAYARLQLLKDTQDGFKIAEKDLALRGAGHFLGTQQTGYRPYKIAEIPRDEHLLERVYRISKALMQDNPQLAQRITARWLKQFESFFHT